MDMSVTHSPADYVSVKTVSAVSASGSTPERLADTPPEDAVAQAPSDKQPSREELTAAVEKIDNYVNATQRNLSFSVDEESGKVVVKVIATATGELIRQLPSAEALKLADKLNDDTLRLIHAEA